MTRFDAWQFPDGETHLQAQLQRWNLRVEGRLTYQYPIYERALEACGSRRGTAVDVGAHVGLWSYWMARDFAQVIAFEPIAAHRDCWTVNMPGRPQDMVYPVALGAVAGSVSMTVPPHKTGDARIERLAGDTPMRTLDSFELSCDLIKIDCEGYEVDVVTGAMETIQRCRPVMAIEQRPKLTRLFRHRGADAIRAVTALGGRQLWTDGHDYVLRFHA